MSRASSRNTQRHAKGQRRLLNRPARFQHQCEILFCALMQKASGRHIKAAAAATAHHARVTRKLFDSSLYLFIVLIGRRR